MEQTNPQLPRVFSGIQPSGQLHLGNYIGAIRQWVKNQEQYDNIFCIVDLHAITVPQDPEELRKNIYQNIAWYLAAGINPSKSIIFVQSDNPDHAQLGWILNNVATIGQLNRMTQYKDKSAGQESTGVGLFDYPVLMAADILLYNTDFVPVGEDQKQHIELARDLAERFNHRFGEIFKLPKYLPPEQGARIMNLQNPTEKMSKSSSDQKGTLYLADSAEEITAKIMSAVTDSESTIAYTPNRPGLFNLITIFAALSEQSPEQIAHQFETSGYRNFKQALAELVVNTLTPMQESLNELQTTGELTKILESGATNAHKISNPKLEQVFQAVGIGSNI